MADGNHPRAERQLQCELLEYLRETTTHSQDERVLLRREVPVGSVIPDVVVVRVPTEPIFSFRRWSWRHAHLVSALRRRRSLHLKTLAAQLFDEEVRLKPVVKDLIAAGAVEPTPTGALTLSPSFRGYRPIIVAFEAKLTRWGEALAQAESYRAFADEVVVVLDSVKPVDDPAVVKRFSNSGVGLWIMHPHGAESTVVPTRREAEGPTREWLAGAMLQHGAQTRWVAR